MNVAVGLMDGLGIDGDRCIRMIPRQVGHHPLKMAGPHLQLPGSCAAMTDFPLHGIYAAVTEFLLKKKGWLIHSKLTGDLGDDEGSIP